MAKRNNNFKQFLIEKIKSEYFKPLLGWLILIFLSFILISLFSTEGYFTLKIKNLLNFLFSWNSYFLILFFILAYFLFKKSGWNKIVSVFLGLILIFLVFDFYFHFIFRQGGVLGDFILGFSQYIGDIGLFFLSFIFLFFGLWLILEEKFFNIFKNIFTQSKDKIDEIQREFKKTVINQPLDSEPPVKLVKKEIKVNNLNQTKSLKIKKIFPKSIWKLPPLDLLIKAKEEVLAPDIKTTTQMIERTLQNFGIKVEVVDVEIGPAITRFALRPGEGVKLSKILSYQSDLALALGTPNLIIETPIPGKAVFGLQVPNKKPANVRLGNLLREKEFLESESLLLFPVGRKIDGVPFFADLAKMPHLLIAGSTGSGKSIFIHNILISFLMKNTPETLNLILIDPKRVELTYYSDLPHLILDPVVEVKKTLGVFNWLIEEMEERYKILEETSSRDIESYNKKQIHKKGKILPRIVVVIDEMADLMVSFGSSIETMIIRLAQMARATGIHLVLATQRPSVDIVTGLIKANIPNRICFKVASYIDSRTVLDVSGAEKLIGEGDGLFLSTSLPRPIRIKAPFVSENEIKKVVNFWKEQAEEIPNFEKHTISLEDLEKRIISFDEDIEDEELFKKAVEVVLEAGKASTSLLQRRLKIGYARAARLLDLMEERGIVGPQEGSKPRKVLITRDYFEEESYNNGKTRQIDE